MPRYRVNVRIVDYTTVEVEAPDSFHAQEAAEEAVLEQWQRGELTDLDPDFEAKDADLIDRIETDWDF